MSDIPEAASCRGEVWWSGGRRGWVLRRLVRERESVRGSGLCVPLPCHFLLRATNLPRPRDYPATHSPYSLSADIPHSLLHCTLLELSTTKPDHLPSPLCNLLPLLERPRRQSEASLLLQPSAYTTATLHHSRFLHPSTLARFPQNPFNAALSPIYLAGRTPVK